MDNVTYKFEETHNKIVEFRKVVVHKIKIMGYSADPEIEIASPLYEWQQTPAGKFIMEHATQLDWTHYLEFNSYSCVYYVVATLEANRLTEYYLKFDIPSIK